MQLNSEKDALFLDIDGTLLDIAQTPQGVIVPPLLTETLGRTFRNLGGALALISGRPLSEIDALFYPLKLPTAGCHGAELRFSPTGEVEAGLHLHASFINEAKSILEAFQGISIENKGFALAVHYRQVPHIREQLFDKLCKLVAPFHSELELMTGKKVFEINLRRQNKAMAIERFLKQKPFSKRRPIFIGDDAVDVPAIEYCRRAGGLGIWVGTKCNGDAMPDPQFVRNWLTNNTTYTQ